MGVLFRLCFPRRIHRPRYYHEPMTLQKRTAANPRKPVTDILSGTDIPRPWNLNLDPDDIMENVDISSGTAAMKAKFR